jgi:hypothetical protein
MFRCIYNFTAELTGKSYFKGERISTAEYHTLRITEKTFFVDEEIEEEDQGDIISSVVIPIGTAILDTIIDNIGNDDSSSDTSSSSDSFSGFDGGDF